MEAQKNGPADTQPTREQENRNTNTNMVPTVESSSVAQDAEPQGISADTAEGDQPYPIYGPGDDPTCPGGFMEALIDWIARTSDQPSRELALAASIPVLGAVIGRQYQSPTGLRTNFFTLGLAPSSFGKGHARKQLKRLLDASGLRRAVQGADGFESAQGLARGLVEKPTQICMIDEFHGLYRQISDDRAGINNQRIRTTLMSLFSDAETSMDGTERAGEAAVVVRNPNLCLYGTTTPAAFWGVTNTGAVADGLLARFIVFDLSDRKPILLDEPPDPSRDIPQHLIDGMQRLYVGKRADERNNMLGAVPNTAQIDAQVVPWSDAAKRLFLDFRRECFDNQEKAAAQLQEIYGKAREHAIKLALLLAVVERPGNPAPSIERRHAIWATDLVGTLIEGYVKAIAENMADSPHEASVKRILKHIRKAGGKGIGASRLADFTRSIEPRARDAILRDLAATGHIEVAGDVGKFGARYLSRIPPHALE
ncbi:DUF3987 domain-containing protein [Microbaculum marinum]|uniref:DUF3987 domain-containing protein n=1 Tax=Microbaculum marinum TaxID=1764581 RepID=A0AAW9RU08_9HYPH